MSVRKVGGFFWLDICVERKRIRRVLVRHHLSRITLPPVKQVERYEAAHPNALWQIDIMGKTHLSLVGELYLICAIDSIWTKAGT